MSLARVCLKGLRADYLAHRVLNNAIYAIHKSVGMNEIHLFFFLGHCLCKVWAYKFDGVFTVLSQACRSWVSPPFPPRTDDL